MELKKFDKGISSKSEIKEIEKILHKLEPGETVIIVAKQIEEKPDLSDPPKIIYATEKKIIVLTHIKIGVREYFEEFPYNRISNVKLEKGSVFSTLKLTVIDSVDSNFRLNTQVSSLDFIPNIKAELLMNFLEKKISANPISEPEVQQVYSKEYQEQNILEDPLRILKSRYASGEISKEEFFSIYSPIQLSFQYLDNALKDLQKFLMDENALEKGLAKQPDNKTLQNLKQQFSEPNASTKEQTIVCFKCNCHNKHNSRFCNNCGSKLDGSCVKCGAQNPVNSKFCNKCGFTLD